METETTEKQDGRLTIQAFFRGTMWSMSRLDAFVKLALS